MSVKYEKTTNVKLTGKGILIGISEDGFEIEDVKEGTIDVIGFGDIKTLLLNKEVSISFGSKEADDN